MHAKLVQVMLAAGMVATVGMSAQAADLYVGGNVGASDWKVGNVPAGTSVDKRDTGFKLFLGTSLSPNFGVEGGYADLGKANLSGGGVSASIKGTGFYADVIGTLPLGASWAAFGRLGAFHGKAKVNVRSGTLSGATNDSGTDVHYGLGVQYGLSKAVALRGEWERFRFNVFNDKGDVDLVSVGLTYSF